jgi:hypothetical protein
MDEAIGCQIGCQDDSEAADQSQEIEESLGEMVSLTFASWNHLVGWLRMVDQLRVVA